MTNAPNARWLCRTCGAVSLGRHVLVMPQPPVRSCPRCKVVGGLNVLCDVPCCGAPAVCAQGDSFRCIDHFAEIRL